MDVEKLTKLNELKEKNKELSYLYLSKKKSGYIINIVCTLIIYNVIFISCLFSSNMVFAQKLDTKSIINAVNTTKLTKDADKCFGILSLNIFRGFKNSEENSIYLSDFIPRISDTYKLKYYNEKPNINVTNLYDNICGGDLITSDSCIKQLQMCREVFDINVNEEEKIKDNICAGFLVSAVVLSGKSTEKKTTISNEILETYTRRTKNQTVNIVALEQQDTKSYVWVIIRIILTNKKTFVVKIYKYAVKGLILIQIS